MIRATRQRKLVSTPARCSIAAKIFEESGGDSPLQRGGRNSLATAECYTATCICIDQKASHPLGR
jgi:hypothetical protein